MPLSGPDNSVAQDDGRANLVGWLRELHRCPSFLPMDPFAHVEGVQPKSDRRGLGYRAASPHERGLDRFGPLLIGLRGGGLEACLEVHPVRYALGGGHAHGTAWQLR